MTDTGTAAQGWHPCLKSYHCLIHNLIKLAQSSPNGKCLGNGLMPSPAWGERAWVFPASFESPNTVFSHSWYSTYSRICGLIFSFLYIGSFSNIQVQSYLCTPATPCIEWVSTTSLELLTNNRHHTQPGWSQTQDTTFLPTDPVCHLSCL